MELRTQTINCNRKLLIDYYWTVVYCPGCESLRLLQTTEVVLGRVLYPSTRGYDYPGIYPVPILRVGLYYSRTRTQIPGKFQILGRLGTTLRTLPKVAGRFGTALGTTLPEQPVGTRVSNRYPRVGFALLSYPYPNTG